jgi:hypothetical protein
VLRVDEVEGGDRAAIRPPVASTLRASPSVPSPTIVVAKPSPGGRAIFLGAFGAWPAEVSNISSIPENRDVSEVALGRPEFSAVPFFTTTWQFPRQCRHYM